MEYDVTIDRSYYIGGSDIPAIMGLSPFKTRWELLLEKAELVENDFTGNRYTVYGQKIEPKIRDYINSKYNTCFEPNRIIDGDFRGHTDGFDGMCVLEIKSTSRIYETVDEYKIYLVQLLKYMEENKVEKGILAVYQRPDDFNAEFDPELLQDFKIDINQYKTLLEEINAEIDRFRADLKRLKENPLLSEEDFQPDELVLLSNKLLVFENRIAEMKKTEQEYADIKKALFEAMQKHDIKSWQTVNGTKITRVDGTPASTKTVTEFDLDTFKEENTALYEMYLKEVEKRVNGRSGYVKITLPK
ncbi:MAG: YqaJ viral recombinase family protein [Clostridia bacterium]|nr:YqaJ viral recombinase family protein [Clostridia bacterium]